MSDVSCCRRKKKKQASGAAFGRKAKFSRVWQNHTHVLRHSRPHPASPLPHVTGIWIWTTSGAGDTNAVATIRLLPSLPPGHSSTRRFLLLLSLLALSFATKQSHAGTTCPFRSRAHGGWDGEAGRGWKAGRRREGSPPSSFSLRPLPRVPPLASHLLPWRDSTTLVYSRS